MLQDRENIRSEAEQVRSEKNQLASEPLTLRRNLDHYKDTLAIKNKQIGFLEGHVAQLTQVELTALLSPVKRRSRKRLVGNSGRRDNMDQSSLKDWLPLIVAMIAAICTIAGNYYLQERSFNAQNRTNQINLRISAYSGLLGHISNYESLSNESDREFISDMGLYLTRAAVYGSPKVKALIIPEIEEPKIKKTSEFNTALSRIKDAMIEEIKIQK